MISWRTLIQGRSRPRAVGLLAGALGLAGFMSAARACELKITWKAALAPSLKGSPSSQMPASGTATIDFDLTHPGATIQVETRNLQDVRVIEMHVARSYADHAGPAVLTLYSASDGRLPAMLTRHVGEPDLHRQTAPKIAAFADLVSAVLNGQAYVIVVTEAHPEGSLSGFIRMHKEEVYSDSASDPAHDAALHHAAKARPTAAASTPPTP